MRIPTIHEIRTRGHIGDSWSSWFKGLSLYHRFKTDSPMVGRMLPPGAEQLFALFRLMPEVVEAVVGLKPYTQSAW